MKRIKTIILYFGADASFEDLNELGYRRRNTNFMRALSEFHEVTVFNVQYAQRRLCVQHHLDSRKTFNTTEKPGRYHNYALDSKRSSRGSPIINALDQSHSMIRRQDARTLARKQEPSIVSWSVLATRVRLMWKLGWNTGQDGL